MPDMFLNDRDQKWQDWAAAAQGGNKNAFNLLLRDIIPFARSILASTLANPDWVDDVVQEVLLSVHKALHTYSADRPFRPWLTTIIKFRRTDFLRRYYGSKTHREAMENDAAANDGHVTNPVHAGEWKDIEAALDQLPEKQRSVFQMARIEGYTVQETAERMNMSVSAVKVSVHRTTKKLKEALGGETE